VRTGTLYLCRTPRAAEDLDVMSRYPPRGDPRWAGVVCFTGTADPRRHYVPWVTEEADHCLRYGAFAVFGDPEVLREVGAILAAEGFREACDP
jgi:hypothetical protein